ncbi:MAG: Fe-S protein assembly chaperone HscA [Gammaproteobacteria bacterium]
MGLLKISGRDKKPEGVAIGIDLGTTHSLVAVYHHDALQVIPDEYGEPLLPSVVCYDRDRCHVGLTSNDCNVQCIRSVKRLMGRSVDDINASKLSTHYSFAEKDKGLLKLKTPVGDRTPIEISAEILKTLYSRAQNFLGSEKIVGAVITVPAYFDEAQRQATKQAAKIAGIKVIRLINEPTAAAIAYGLNQREAGTCLVFDLGGGTFDISLLSMQKGIFEVLATGGDTLLGGDDIDQLIVDWIIQEASLSNPATQRLLSLAKESKERLTTESTVSISYADWTGQLDRATLNRLMHPLIERMLAHCERVLRDAHCDKASVNELILVGGATRIPYLREQLTTWFEKPIHTSLNPDEIVALGAALQADQLSGNRSKQDILLLDVIPLSLGLEMMSGTVEKMVMRNTPLPATRSEMFTTYQDYQTGLMIHVVQGERELVKDCRSLARFHLKGFPPMLAGKAKIKVTFQVDVDGLLTVTAQEQSSDTQIEVMIESTAGLSDRDITDLIEASILNADSDMKAKRLQALKFEATQLIELAKNDLSKWGQILMSAQELKTMEAVSASMEEALQSNDLTVIDACKREFDPWVERLAERKLNYSLMVTLEGKRVDEVLDAEN